MTIVSCEKDLKQENQEEESICVNEECINGICINGICVCCEGWYGLNCNSESPQNEPFDCEDTNCGENGNCNEITNRCDCNDFYWGLTCEKEVITSENFNVSTQFTAIQNLKIHDDGGYLFLGGYTQANGGTIYYDDWEFSVVKINEFGLEERLTLMVLKNGVKFLKNILTHIRII